MHEPVLVGDVQRLRYLIQHGNGAHRLQPADLPEQPPEIAAFHVAHGDEEHTFGLAGLVDGDHVRVVDRGGEARLAQEPLPEGVIGRQFGSEQLERHLALERSVVCQVHDPHPAAAQQCLDPVAGQHRANPRVGRHCHVRNRTAAPFASRHEGAM